MNSASKLFLTVYSIRYLKRYKDSLVPRYMLWSYVQNENDKHTVNILRTNSKSELIVKMAVWGMKLGNIAEKCHTTILKDGKLTKCDFRTSLEVKKICDV